MNRRSLFAALAAAIVAPVMSACAVTVERPRLRRRWRNLGNGYFQLDGKTAEPICCDIEDPQQIAELRTWWLHEVEGSKPIACGHVRNVPTIG